LGLEGGSVSGGRIVGGLVGGIEEYGTVSNCYSTGDVNGGGIVGGLIGFMYGSRVSNCYSTGDVSGTGDHIGGLVGYAAGIVSNCYSTGNVSGDYEVGGLMGGNENISISNCYSTGDVNGVGEVGGLMGKNLGLVSNCYSTGDVQGAGVENVGGLVGYHYSPGISYCFWNTDTQTHGVTESIGGGSGVVTNVLGLPTFQLHQKSTFTNWDFISIWNIGENQTYPYLRVYLPSDINKDRIVNFLDFAITANKWMEEK
ncbi:MAG: GLUG motif-containing protein, partial [Planctomycetota bacterium]